jgi:DNA-binding transcriptional MerR regulator
VIEEDMVDMRRLKTSEAAALLNVSPHTLRTWERRFGFPQPQRSPGRHRLYTPSDVAVLRDALNEGLSVASAVSRAREGLAADARSLVGALLSYDRERADAALEATLALRSLERSVAQVLLPSLDEIVATRGPDSAAWAFATRWAMDWLHRAIRLAPPPIRQACILLGDASRDELDPDAPHIRALELLCVRASIKVLTLSVRGLVGIGDVLARRRLTLVVVAGSHVDDDTVARWAYAVRLAAGRVPIAVYRRGDPKEGRTMLPSAPLEARRRLLDLVKAHQMRRPMQSPAAAPRDCTSTPAAAPPQAASTTLGRAAGF